MVSCVQIDDFVLYETYSLSTLEQGVPQSSGGDIIFRVGNATTCTLCAHLLIEGYIF